MLNKVDTTKLKENVKHLINTNLDRAEEIWQNGGSKILTLNEHLRKVKANDSAFKMESSKGIDILSKPNSLSERDFIVDDLITICVDLRDSQKISSTFDGKFNGLQSIFYITYAMLPATELVIKNYSGTVTEYLGDGVLGFLPYEYEKNNNEATYECIRNANRAANFIVNDMRNCLNDTLKKRYARKNDIDLGIGLAWSKVIIHSFGLDNKYQKAFGESVAVATRLSSERNKICVDKHIKKAWPTSKVGKLKFTKKMFGKKEDTEGFIKE